MLLFLDLVELIYAYFTYALIFQMPDVFTYFFHKCLLPLPSKVEGGYVFIPDCLFVCLLIAGILRIEVVGFVRFPVSNPGEPRQSGHGDRLICSSRAGSHVCPPRYCAK